MLKVPYNTDDGLKAGLYLRAEWEANLLNDIKDAICKQIDGVLKAVGGSGCKEIDLSGNAKIGMAITLDELAMDMEFNGFELDCKITDLDKNKCKLKCNIDGFLFDVIADAAGFVIEKLEDLAGEAVEIAGEVAADAAKIVKGLGKEVGASVKFAKNAPKKLFKSVAKAFESIGGGTDRETVAYNFVTGEVYIVLFLIIVDASVFSLVCCFAKMSSMIHRKEVRRHQMVSSHTSYYSRVIDAQNSLTSMPLRAGNCFQLAMTMTTFYPRQEMTIRELLVSMLAICGGKRTRNNSKSATTSDFLAACTRNSTQAQNVVAKLVWMEEPISMMKKQVLPTLLSKTLKLLRISRKRVKIAITTTSVSLGYAAVESAPLTVTPTQNATPSLFSLIRSATTMMMLVSTIWASITIVILILIRANPVEALHHLDTTIFLSRARHTSSAAVAMVDIGICRAMARAIVWTPVAGTVIRRMNSNLRSSIKMAGEWQL